ncbi:hypothetical protein DK66_3154 [Brucella suis 1330]|nr:hypothetical protein DK66_3154 [Brucella suis 1330]
MVNAWFARQQADADFSGGGRLFSGVSVAVQPCKIADEITDARTFFGIEREGAHHVHCRNSDTCRHQSVDDPFAKLGR